MLFEFFLFLLEVILVVLLLLQFLFPQLLDGLFGLIVAPNHDFLSLTLQESEELPLSLVHFLQDLLLVVVNLLDVLGCGAFHQFRIFLFALSFPLNCLSLLRVSHINALKSILLLRFFLDDLKGISRVVFDLFAEFVNNLSVLGFTPNILLLILLQIVLSCLDLRFSFFVLINSLLVGSFKVLNLIFLFVLSCFLELSFLLLDTR